MSNITLRNIAIVAGIVLFVPAFVISPALAVVLTIIVVGAGYVAMRAIGNSEVRVKKDRHSDVLDRMWIPVRDELSEVVRMGGSVTAASSVWSGVPNLYKQETPATFHQGMERYVNERAEVAALVASASTTEESQQRQEIGQQDLLLISRELLEEARKVINLIPGSEEAVRRANAVRPRPSAQRPRPAATGRRTATRQPTPVRGTAHAQAMTPTRTISARPSPSRPAPATMSSAVETPAKPSAPRPPSRPAPTPLRITDTPAPPEPAVPREPEPQPSAPPPRITYTPMPSPPAVVPPPRLEPEPPPSPSAPPAPSPVTASVPEPAEPVKPTEPVVATPAPSVPEPTATPTSPPDVLRLDVASVCEELFNPKMMSYEANRLFDDRYKDATVRWRGTARRASTYSYDFNFGDGGGTKAELDVYEVKQQYGSRTVKAFVQLPVEAATAIGGRIGEEIEFEGRLMTCEGSARRLYVTDARMVD